MFHGELPIDTQAPDPERELEATRQTLAQGLEVLRLHPAPGVTEQLSRLALLLADWAPKMNLTGHRGADSIARRLILDAVALANVLPEYESLVDLGSGAGFPGLPLAILRQDRPVVSVEARAKRISFQKTVVRTLGLENVTVVQGRIEELPPTQGQCVIAQAVAAPASVTELMLPWCRTDGWMAVPGTPESLAALPPAAPGCEPGEIRRYQVPLQGADRRVWITRPTS